MEGAGKRNDCWLMGHSQEDDSNVAEDGSGTMERISGFECQGFVLKLNLLTTTYLELLSMRSLMCTKG